MFSFFSFNEGDGVTKVKAPTGSKIVKILMTLVILIKLKKAINYYKWRAVIIVNY